MRTISSDPATSLLFWSQNSNRSNVFEDRLGGDRLFLKSNYASLFRTLETEFKSKRLSRFIPTWKSALIFEMENVRKRLVGRVPNIEREDLDKILVKFQGNVGEIFAEKFFLSGYGRDVCLPNSYQSVDPHHEEGVDAFGISPKSGLKIGIQVKNYLKSEVSQEVFRTAGDESDKLRCELTPEQFPDSLKCPLQYIFSFGEAAAGLKAENEKRIGFLGPGYIESKHICGTRGDSCGDWMFFGEIADEIESVS